MVRLRPTCAGSAGTTTLLGARGITIMAHFLATWDRGTECLRVGENMPHRDCLVDYGRAESRNPKLAPGAFCVAGGVRSAGGLLVDKRQHDDGVRGARKVSVS